MGLQPRKIIAELEANPDFRRLYCDDVRELYEATLYRIQHVSDDAERPGFHADQSGIKPVDLAEWLNIDSSNIYELLNGKILTPGKRWSEKRLRGWCEKITACLVGRGVLLPTDDFCREELAEIMTKSHHDRVIQACRLSLSEAVVTMSGLSNEAYGLFMRGSSQSGRYAVNALMGWQQILEGAENLFQGLQAPLRDAVMEDICQMIDCATIAVSRRCAKSHLVAHKGPGYGGYALFLHGLADNNPERIRKGWDLMKAALAIPHDQPGEKPAFHWLNASRALRSLFAKNEAVAKKLAGEIDTLLDGCDVECVTTFVFEMKRSSGMRQVFELLLGTVRVDTICRRSVTRPATSRKLGTLGALMLALALVGEGGPDSGSGTCVTGPPATTQNTFHVDSGSGT